MSARVFREPLRASKVSSSSAGRECAHVADPHSEDARCSEAYVCPPTFSDAGRRQNSLGESFRPGEANCTSTLIRAVWEVRARTRPAARTHARQQKNRKGLQTGSLELELTPTSSVYSQRDTKSKNRAAAAAAPRPVRTLITRQPKISAGR